MGGIEIPGRLPYFFVVQIQFAKMNGAGNDFVLIDNRASDVVLSAAQVANICHRQRGVGADGVILLKPCADEQADWAWDFFNSDGSEAEMCGNGARCFARYLSRVTELNGEISFLTGSGVIRAQIDGSIVTVNLTDPTDLRLDENVLLSIGERQIHSINTGVPHAVVFVDDADEVMVASLGNEVRHHEHFEPAGTNVNFVQLIKPSRIRVRTYERGVGETLACGTGVAAAAMIAGRLHDFVPPIKVDVFGGDTLEVSFNEDLSNVRLTGPAEFVYEGVIEI
jgi:diaminopimelate epimerase